MVAFIDQILGHLQALVACDTQNPPRHTAASGIGEYLRQALPGFQMASFDYGDGCHNFLMTRNRPRILFNCHLDTVPVTEGWTSDPFVLTVADGRATGLGACDIKGAAAAMIAAANATAGDVAILFSTDEEAGNSRCIRRFIDDGGLADFEAVIVAEPTGAQAVVEHRGIATCTGEFEGVAGHASKRRALTDSAVHRAVNWSAAAIERAQELESKSYGPLQGIRFNLGTFTGGIKPNMIAAEARLRLGCRPLPDQDGRQLLASLQALPGGEYATWTPGFFGPTLPAEGDSALARKVAEELGLPVSDAVDFWTEAALFSQAQVPALVFGPGDITQAHTANEWVSIDQLLAAAKTYRRLMTKD